MRLPRLGNNNAKQSKMIGNIVGVVTNYLRNEGDKLLIFRVASILARHN